MHSKHRSPIFRFIVFCVWCVACSILGDCFHSSECLLPVEEVACFISKGFNCALRNLNFGYESHVCCGHGHFLLRI